VVIFLVRIVAKVMERLHGRRQAGNADAGDVAESGEALSRVGGGRAVLQPLRGRPRGVKGDGVEVDTVVMSVSDHESGGQLGEGDAEPEDGKGVAGDWDIRARDDAIEAVVFSGLLADQGVDTPAPIQPDADPGIFQGDDDSEETLCIHHIARSPVVEAMSQTLTRTISISIMSPA
jgi:hypothetical protein